MKLAFSTHLDGKPTYFVERIHSGLIMNDLMDGFETKLTHTNFSIDAFAEKHMKIHTLRNDVDDVWQRGVPIEFMINNEEMNAFKFAPVLPVVSTQKIAIEWIEEKYKGGKYNPTVWIDDMIFFDELFNFGREKMEQLSHNDGFDTIQDFFAYFNDNFTGKIIHWTELKY